MTLGWAGGVGTARCVALAGESCNAPIPGSAGPPSSSIQSLTSNGSWAHALRYLLAALHVCIRICHHRIYQSSRSVCET